jgi:hypothetical protein
MIMDLVKMKGIKILQGRLGIKFDLLRSDTQLEENRVLEY